MGNTMISRDYYLRKIYKGCRSLLEDGDVLKDGVKVSEGALAEIEALAFEMFIETIQECIPEGFKFVPATFSVIDRDGNNATNLVNWDGVTRQTLDKIGMPLRDYIAEYNTPRGGGKYAEVAEIINRYYEPEDLEIPIA